MGNLDGRVAIVTGATGSMGVTIAKRLAADFAYVACLGRNASRGEAAASDIRAAGGQSIFDGGTIE